MQSRLYTITKGLEIKISPSIKSHLKTTAIIAFLPVVVGLVAFFPAIGPFILGFIVGVFGIITVTLLGTIYGDIYDGFERARKQKEFNINSNKKKETSK